MKASFFFKKNPKKTAVITSLPWCTANIRVILLCKSESFC